MMERLLNVAEEKKQLNAKERAQLEKATGIQLSSGSEAAMSRNASKKTDSTLRVSRFRQLEVEVP